MSRAAAVWLRNAAIHGAANQASALITAPRIRARTKDWFTARLAVFGSSPPKLRATIAAAPVPTSANPSVTNQPK